MGGAVVAEVNSNGSTGTSRRSLIHSWILSPVRDECELSIYQSLRHILDNPIDPEETRPFRLLTTREARS
jgi:hypothetical protein